MSNKHPHGQLQHFEPSSLRERRLIYNELEGNRPEETPQQEAQREEERTIESSEDVAATAKQEVDGVQTEITDIRTNLLQFDPTGGARQQLDLHLQKILDDLRPQPEEEDTHDYSQGPRGGAKGGGGSETASRAKGDAEEGVLTTEQVEALREEATGREAILLSRLFTLKASERVTTDGRKIYPVYTRGSSGEVVATLMSIDERTGKMQIKLPDKEWKPIAEVDDAQLKALSPEFLRLKTLDATDTEALPEKLNDSQLLLARYTEGEKILKGRGAIPQRQPDGTIAFRLGKNLFSFYNGDGAATAEWRVNNASAKDFGTLTMEECKRRAEVAAGPSKAKELYDIMCKTRQKSDENQYSVYVFDRGVKIRELAEAEFALKGPEKSDDEKARTGDSILAELATARDTLRVLVELSNAQDAQSITAIAEAVKLPPETQEQLEQRVILQGGRDLLRNRGAAVDGGVDHAQDRGNFYGFKDSLGTSSSWYETRAELDPQFEKQMQERKNTLVARSTDGKLTAYFRAGKEADGKPSWKWSINSGGPWVALDKDPWNPPLPDNIRDDILSRGGTLPPGEDTSTKSHQELRAMATELASLKTDVRPGSPTVLKAESEAEDRRYLDTVAQANRNSLFVPLYNRLIDTNNSRREGIPLFNKDGQPYHRFVGTENASALAMLTFSSPPPHVKEAFGVYIDDQTGELRDARNNATLWPREPGQPSFRDLFQQPAKPVSVLKSLPAGDNQALKALQEYLQSYDTNEPLPIAPPSPKAARAFAIQTEKERLFGKAYIQTAQDLIRSKKIFSDTAKQQDADSEGDNIVQSLVLDVTNVDSVYENARDKNKQKARSAEQYLELIARHMPTDGTVDGKLALLADIRRMTNTKNASNPNLEEINSSLGKVQGILEGVKEVNDFVAGFVPGGKYITGGAEILGEAVQTGEIDRNKVAILARDGAIDYVTGKIKIPKGLQFNTKETTNRLVKSGKNFLNKKIEEELKKPIKDALEQSANDVFDIEKPDKPDPLKQVKKEAKGAIKAVINGFKKDDPAKS